MERDHVMALDFDPTVVGIASQPFWLSWRDDAGKLISHAPDFFARRADGTPTSGSNSDKSMTCPPPLVTSR